MALDIRHTQELLCARLCSAVSVVERKNGLLMLDTPFTYPDGDRYPIYIRELPSGGVRLSDGGHTLMHLSYENDVDTFRKGTRGRLMEQIVAETGVAENEGEFYVDTSLSEVADAVFRLGQALTKVYDITFLSRSRVTSTFYEDLSTLLYSIVPEEKINKDFIESRMESAEDYPIDYYMPGKVNEPLYLFGIPNRDKARLTTITLERLLRFVKNFDSILVFQNLQELKGRDLARLTNVGGEAVASLDAREDLERKILRRVA